MSNIYRIMFDMFTIQDSGITLYVTLGYNPLDESFSCSFIIDGFYNLLDSERGVIYGSETEV